MHKVVNYRFILWIHAKKGLHVEVEIVVVAGVFMNYESVVALVSFE